MYGSGAIDRVGRRSAGSAVACVEVGGAGGYGIYAYVSDLVEILNNSVLNTMGTSSNAVFVSGSTNVTVMGNRLLNGETAGSTGINVFGGPGINCINNVIARFTTPISNCSFLSGNITP